MESQSRYSIMEEFNQKKINAQNRLAQVKKEMKEKEKENRYSEQNTQKAINHEKNNYKFDHKTWKENTECDLANYIAEKKLEIKMMGIKLDNHAKGVEASIKKRDSTFEGDHEEILKKMEQKLENIKENYANYVELKNMDITSIEVEITEINNAIINLKEMSSEQAK